jgi:hypothetical protein
MAFDGFHARAALANHSEPIDAAYSALSHEGAVFSAAQTVFSAFPTRSGTPIRRQAHREIDHRFVIEP